MTEKDFWDCVLGCEVMNVDYQGNVIPGRSVSPDTASVVRAAVFGNETVMVRVAMKASDGNTVEKIVLGIAVSVLSRSPDLPEESN